MGSAQPDYVNKNFKFSHFPIVGKSVFYESKHCIAFTNLSCVLPGHVLIIPKQCFEKFVLLPDKVRDDLAATTKFVATVMKKFYQSRSVSFCFQNGAAAGCTVFHQHVHILPEMKSHYPPYIQCFDSLPRKELNGRVTLPNNSRSREEMNEEAAAYRQFIADNFVPRESYTHFLRSYLAVTEDAQAHM